jgi:hypothetical protein
MNIVLKDWFYAFLPPRAVFLFYDGLIDKIQEWIDIEEEIGRGGTPVAYLDGMKRIRDNMRAEMENAK